MPPGGAASGSSKDRKQKERKAIDEKAKEGII
jgi:hypothetical protein